MINQMNIGTVLKVVLEKLRARMDGVCMGFTEHIDTILN